MAGELGACIISLFRQPPASGLSDWRLLSALGDLPGAPTVRLAMPLENGSCAAAKRKAAVRRAMSGVVARRSAGRAGFLSCESSRIASCTKAHLSVSCRRHFSSAARRAFDSWDICACAPETGARSSRARCLHCSSASRTGLEGVPSKSVRPTVAIGAARHVGNFGVTECRGVPMLPRLPGVAGAPCAVKPRRCGLAEGGVHGVADWRGLLARVGLWGWGGLAEGCRAWVCGGATA